MTISEHKTLDTQNIARMPKHDDVVEEMVIASLLKFDNLRDYVYRLGPDDFYNEQNKKYFCDILAVVKTSPDFDINAVPFKTDLLINYYHRPDVLQSKFNHYFKRLKALSNIRKIERLAYQMEIDCQEDKNDIDIKNKYLQQLDSIKPYDLGDITTAVEVNAEYEQVLNYDWRKQIPTGFEALDKIIGGFHRSCFYAIAGVPGVGKTTFMLNIMQNIAEMEKKILFACLEMPYREIINKFVSKLTEMSTTKLRGFNRCETVEEEKTALTTAREMATTYDINFIGRNGLYVSDIKDRIEYLSKVDIVFIDYLQLIKPSSGKTRYEQITQISRELKLIAIKFNIPVVTIASINRANVTRLDKKPQLSDFRDSGNIEYDLDCALLLYRSSQFHADANIRDAELNIGKNRYGKSNIEFKMTWLPEQSQFKDMEVKREQS